MAMTKLVRALLGIGIYKILGFIEIIFKDILRNLFPHRCVTLNEILDSTGCG